MPLRAVVENIVTVIAAAALSGLAIWWLNSLWGLLGLVLMLNINYVKPRRDAEP